MFLPTECINIYHLITYHTRFRSGINTRSKKAIAIKKKDRFKINSTKCTDRSLKRRTRKSEGKPEPNKPTTEIKNQSTVEKTLPSCH